MSSIRDKKSAVGLTHCLPCDRGPIQMPRYSALLVMLKLNNEETLEDKKSRSEDTTAGVKGAETGTKKHFRGFNFKHAECSAR